MISSFQTRIALCTLFGIPVYLDSSLIILALLFLTGGGTIASGFVCCVLLLVSITAHELGHALTARAFGYETRDITLSLLGGCAALIALPRRASQELLTAIAGPAVSIALSLAGAAGLAALAVEGGFADALLLIVSETLGGFGININPQINLAFNPDNLVALQLFLYLGTMNLMLALFNLLPGFPMDGGRIFRSAIRPFMSRVRATYFAMMVGRVVAVGIAVRGVMAILGNGNWGFVSCLIAWMIWREGWREYQLAAMESHWKYSDYRARISPPPYGGDGDECEIRRN